MIKEIKDPILYTHNPKQHLKKKIKIIDIPDIIIEPKKQQT